MNKEATLKVAVKSHSLGIDVLLRNQHNFDMSMLIKLVRSILVRVYAFMGMRKMLSLLVVISINYLLQANDCTEMKSWLKRGNIYLL